MQEITTEELKKLLDKKENFVLLDCRSADSYEEEHIIGAINIRWIDIPEKAEALIPNRNTFIVTYCSGITCDASIRCYKNLKKLGYKNVREYSGGITEWKGQGYKTISL